MSSASARLYKIGDGVDNGGLHVLQSGAVHGTPARRAGAHSCCGVGARWRVRSAARSAVPPHIAPTVSAPGIANHQPLMTASHEQLTEHDAAA